MVDSKFHQYNLRDLTDVAAHSTEREVTVIPPANAQGYTITPIQEPVVVSCLNHDASLAITFSLMLYKLTSFRFSKKELTTLN